MGRAVLLHRCCGSPVTPVVTALRTRTPPHLPSPPFQFSESRRLLLDWMDEVEQSLEVPQDTATSQEEIKCQLAEHKVGGRPRSPAPRRWGAAAWLWAVGGRAVGWQGRGLPSGTAGPQCARRCGSRTPVQGCPCRAGTPPAEGHRHPELESPRSLPAMGTAPVSRGSGWAHSLCPQAFQKVLRSKRPVYEATLRSGRALRERARLPEDLQPLEELLGELKERWDALCSRAVER